MVEQKSYFQKHVDQLNNTIYNVARLKIMYSIVEMIENYEYIGDFFEIKEMIFDVQEKFEKFKSYVKENNCKKLLLNWYNEYDNSDKRDNFIYELKVFFSSISDVKSMLRINSFISLDHKKFYCYKELVEQTCYDLYSLRLEAIYSLKEIEKFVSKIDEKLESITDKNITSLLAITKDISSEEKRKIVMNFFDKSGSGHDSNLLYEKIKNNNLIVNLILSGEKLISNFENINNLGDYFVGDFTYLVVCHIKSVETYLKELLIENLIDEEIYMISRDSKTNLVKITNKLTIKEKTSIEDLNKFELGGLRYFISDYHKKHCGKNNKLIDFKTDSYYNEVIKSVLYEGDLFYKWVKNVRNGHLHTHPIETIKEAIDIRNKTSEILAKLIYEFKPLMN